MLSAVLLLALGLAACNRGSVEATVTARPTTGEPADAVAATTGAPGTKGQSGAVGSIEFVIPNDHQWDRVGDNGYAISGEEDTFAWSKQAVSGDFELSVDVESDFANYGEAMVVVYGDGQSWTPGCLIFNVTGYWQAIRAHTIYEPDVEWVVNHEEKLDFANRSRYRMTIRVANDEASLLVDDRLVASTPMLGEFNRAGYIALAKYGGSAPVTFSNIMFEGEGGELAPTTAPPKTATVTLAPTSTRTPKPTATVTPKPTLTPIPTATLPPTDTPWPTDTPPPPYRPPTGFLEDRSAGGYGELSIKNGTDADALVILTYLDDQPVKSAYIRAAETFNMTGIPDGTYRLYYSKGEAFNQATNRFTQNATYQRLDATIEFTTSATQYTTWEVTLYGVVGGTVGSEPVDPSDFP